MYYSVSEFLIGEKESNSFYEIKLHTHVCEFESEKDYNPLTKTLHGYDIIKDTLNLFSKENSKNLISKISKIIYSPTCFSKSLELEHKNFSMQPPKSFEEDVEYRVFSMELCRYITIKVLRYQGKLKASISNSYDFFDLESLQIGSYHSVLDKEVVLNFLVPSKSIYRFLSTGSVGKLKFEIQEPRQARSIECFHYLYDVNVPSVIVINSETFKVEDISKITKTIRSTFVSPYPSYISDLKNGYFEILQPYGSSYTSYVLKDSDLISKPTVTWNFEVTLFIRQNTEIALNILDENFCINTFGQPLSSNLHTYFLNMIPVKKEVVLDKINQMLSRIEK